VTEAITGEFERWLGHVLAVAGSACQRPDAWQAIRSAWLPGAPGTVSYLGEAAHPSQVREVLVALHAAYAARLPPEAPGESEAMRDFRRRRLPDFVRDETSAYIARVTPKAEVSSVFARAVAGSRPPVAASGSVPAVTVRTCRRCGAPREADTVYGSCAFCGTDFFPQHD
jgi:hypothetical protein